jgi:hypothetical protein
VKAASTSSTWNHSAQPPGWTGAGASCRKIAKASLSEQWVRDYGEDSDFVRVRVRGVFPHAGSMQFISSELVEAAAGSDRRVALVRDEP